MREDRQQELLAAAATCEGPATFVYVDIHNFKAFNVLRNHKNGDRQIARLQERLGAIGRTWRVGGDEFVVLALAPHASVRQMVRAVSWLMNITLGATEAWSIRFSDGRPELTVPYVSYVVSCTPRCGLAEVQADPAAALALAERRCDDLAFPDRSPARAAALAEGFPPLGPRMGDGATELARRGCPACGHDRPTTISVDLGYSDEMCPRCDARYDRINKMFVLEEDFEAGYG